MWGLATNFHRWSFGFEFQRARQEWSFLFGPYLLTWMTKSEEALMPVASNDVAVTDHWLVKLYTHPYRICFGFWMCDPNIHYMSFQLAMFDIDVLRRTESLSRIYKIDALFDLRTR